MTTIELPVYGITINVANRDGSISSSGLQDDAASPEYRAAVDGLLSLILGHACAGINVRSPVYLEGIEVGMDHIWKQYGE